MKKTVNALTKTTYRTLTFLNAFGWHVAAGFVSAIAYGTPYQEHADRDLDLMDEVVEEHAMKLVEAIHSSDLTYRIGLKLGVRDRYSMCTPEQLAQWAAENMD